MCNQILLPTGANRKWPSLAGCRSGATKSDKTRVPSMSISVSQPPTASKSLSKSTLRTSRCLSPAVVVPERHDGTQKRVKEFWVCRRCPCSRHVRLASCMAADLNWSVESTADSLCSSSSFSLSVVTRPCLLPCMSPWRAGFHQRRLSKSFLVCVTVSSRVRRTCTHAWSGSSSQSRRSPSQAADGSRSPFRRATIGQGVPVGS